MSAPGKWDTHQQLRAKALAAKEASNLTPKPSKIENVQIPVELVEVPVETKVEVPIEVVEEANPVMEEPEVQVDPIPEPEEIKPELKPISKKKNKE